MKLLRKHQRVFPLAVFCWIMAFLPSVRQAKDTAMQVPSATASASKITPEEIVIQHGPEDDVRAVAFSPDGRYFATASSWGVRIWNCQSGGVEQNLATAGPISSLAWSPDGSRLAGGGLTLETGFWRGLVYVWQAASGRVLHDWRTGYAVIRALTWSRDGRILATAGGGDFEGRGSGASARLWTPDGGLLRTLENYTASDASLGVSSDNRRIALNFWDDFTDGGGNRVYDLLSGKRITPPQTGSSSKTEFSTGNNPDKKKPSAPLPDMRGKGITDTFLSPDGHWLVATGSPSNQEKSPPAFQLWNLQDKPRRWVLKRQVEFNRSVPITLAVGPDPVPHETLGVGLLSGAAALWDLRSGRPRVVVPGLFANENIALSPKADYLASSFLWDIRGVLPRRGLTLTGYRAMAFSPSGERFIDENGLLDIKSGKRLPLKIVDENDEDHLTGLHSASFSADEQIIATVDETRSDGELHLWNGKTGALLPQAEQNFYVRFSCLSFAPQGRILAIAGVTEGFRPRPAKSFLELLDGSTGKLLRRFRIAADDPYGIADLEFSPDGKTLATTGIVFRGYGSPTAQEERRAIQTNRLKTPERTVRFWDVATGKLRSSLPLSFNYSTSLAFINNRVCAVITPSGVEFWNIAQSKLLAQLTILAVRREKDTAALEWLVQSPNGAWDVSAGADSFLRWRSNGVLQVQAPSTTTRVPGLLGLALGLHS